MNFAKFLGTPFLNNTSRWLLLKHQETYKFSDAFRGRENRTLGGNVLRLDIAKAILFTR